jgi:hypothetical protein
VIPIVWNAAPHRIGMAGTSPAMTGEGVTRDGAMPVSTHRERAPVARGRIPSRFGGSPPRSISDRERQGVATPPP